MRTVPGRALVLLASLAVCSQVAAAEESTGVLTMVRGPVEVRLLDRDDFAPAQAGMELHPGDAIRTGHKGRALVKLGESIELRIGSDSMIEIQLDENTDTQRRSVALYLGVLFAKVGKVAGGDNPFEVYAANAVAGVRGTQFVTAVSPDGSVRTQVKEGRVVLEAEGSEVSLLPGQYSDAEMDQVPREAAQHPGTKWKDWLKAGNDKLLERAPATAERWMAQSQDLEQRLQDLRTRAEQLTEQIADLEGKARVARHGKQQEALVRIQTKLSTLVEEAIEGRSQIRRVATGLQTRLLLLDRLAAQARERMPELAPKVAVWEERYRTLQPLLGKTRREVLRNLRRQVRIERQLMQKLKLRYREILRQKAKLVKDRLHAPGR